MSSSKRHAAQPVRTRHIQTGRGFVFCILDGADKKRIPENLTEHRGGFYHEKDFAQIVFEGRHRCLCTHRTDRLRSGDESAAVSVAKDENGAYVDTLTITLGRFAEPSAAALFPEGQTFEDNAYTRYIESKLNVDLVDSFEAGGDAFTNQLATCVASGELPDIMTVISYDTFVEMVNNGLTYDMTDVYEEYASDYIKSLYDSYDGRCLSMATFDGRLMGIPGTNPDNSVPVLCWMRKDWLDKLGINPDPDGDLCITLDDIAAVAKAFVDANVGGGNSTVGMAFSGNDIGDAMCIANAMGGYIDRWIENPDGTMSWSTLTPEVKAAWPR